MYNRIFECCIDDHVVPVLAIEREFACNRSQCWQIDLYSDYLRTQPSTLTVMVRSLCVVTSKCVPIRLFLCLQTV